MNKILLTGATGFAGSNTLNSLIEEQENGNDIQIILGVRNKRSITQNFNGEIKIGDLRDKDYCDKLTKNVDVICHAAAWAELNGSLENSNKYFYEPTINLINSALKNNIKRFIFLSAITSNPIRNNRLHTKSDLIELWPHYHNIIRIENYLQEISSKEFQVVILKVGFFTGINYSLGILPILLPRLKTHLVPWIENGNTSLPLINGKDIGTAFKLASLANIENNYNNIDIVGKSIPTVKEFFTYLNKKYFYPLPKFNVSFETAYKVAFFLRRTHKLLPGDPLIVPAVVLLLEETNSNNLMAKRILNYTPQIDWKESIDEQIMEMNYKQKRNMKMNKQ